MSFPFPPRRFPVPIAPKFPTWLMLVARPVRAAFVVAQRATTSVGTNPLVSLYSCVRRMKRRTLAEGVIADPCTIRVPSRRHWGYKCVHRVSGIFLKDLYSLHSSSFCSGFLLLSFFVGLLLLNLVA